MARNEFLLNPLCEDVADFIAIYQDKPEKRVISIALDDRGHGLDFQPEASVTIREYPLPDTHKLPEADAAELRESLKGAQYPMFKSPPLKVEAADVAPKVEEGRPVLLAHAEGTVTYRLSDKHRKITGKFGIMHEAYEKPGETDGVLFVIECVTSDGKKTMLFQRELDPKARPADRGEQSFDIAATGPYRGHGNFTYDQCAGRNGAWDWSYWTELELQE